MTHRSFREDLQRQLRDPKFAKDFGEAQAKSSLALTLAEARRKAGFTQKELADKAGVTQAYIAKLEGGEANPTVERIGSLLAVMGLSLTTGTTGLSPYTESSAWITDWATDRLLISQLQVPFSPLTVTDYERLDALTIWKEPTLV